MMRVAIRIAAPLAALLATSALAFAEEVRTGKAAYGDWHSDAPGVTRKITAADVLEPLETPPTANRSKVVPKPADAVLKVPEGYSRAVCDRNGRRARHSYRAERRYFPVTKRFRQDHRDAGRRRSLEAGVD